MFLGDILNIEDVIIDQNLFITFGLSDLNEGSDKPIDTINLNILGNANILECSKKHKIQRFIVDSIYVFSDLGSFIDAVASAEQYIIEFKNMV